MAPEQGGNSRGGVAGAVDNVGAVGRGGGEVEALLAGVGWGVVGRGGGDGGELGCFGVPGGGVAGRGGSSDRGPSEACWGGVGSCGGGWLPSQGSV